VFPNTGEWNTPLNITLPAAKASTFFVDTLIALSPAHQG
jgi:hypothetical protein